MITRNIEVHSVVGPFTGVVDIAGTENLIASQMSAVSGQPLSSIMVTPYAAGSRRRLLQTNVSFLVTFYAGSNDTLAASLGQLVTSPTTVAYLQTVTQQAVSVTSTPCFGSDLSYTQVVYYSVSIILSTANQSYSSAVASDLSAINAVIANSTTLITTGSTGSAGSCSPTATVIYPPPLPPPPSPPPPSPPPPPVKIFSGVLFFENVSDVSMHAACTCLYLKLCSGCTFDDAVESALSAFVNVSFVQYTDLRYTAYVLFPAQFQLSTSSDISSVVFDEVRLDFSVYAADGLESASAAHDAIAAKFSGMCSPYSASFTTTLREAGLTGLRRVHDYEQMC